MSSGRETPHITQLREEKETFAVLKNIFNCAFVKLTDDAGSSAHANNRKEFGADESREDAPCHEMPH
jgi:hypothetical protein